MSADAPMRLQRFLARAGVASRRKAETLIVEGRVSVNGRVVRELGTKVDARRDRVSVDGRRVLAEDHIWLLLNKPRETVSTTSDPEGRRTVLDLVGEQGARLYPVGRLDYHSEGALILTNDGDLAHALMHPRHHVPRVYHVKLKGIVGFDDFDRLREGVVLDTGETARADVMGLATTGVHTWVEMTLRQGLNRQIHRMAEAIGTEVLKLIRVSLAGITIEGLKTGTYRPLAQSEITELRKALELPAQTKKESPSAGGRRRARSRRSSAGQTSTPLKRPRPKRRKPR